MGWKMGGALVGSASDWTVAWIERGKQICAGSSRGRIAKGGLVRGPLSKIYRSQNAAAFFICLVLYHVQTGNEKQEHKSLSQESWKPNIRFPDVDRRSTLHKAHASCKPEGVDIFDLSSTWSSTSSPSSAGSSWKNHKRKVNTDHHAQADTHRQHA